ncbi:MAG: twin-arginine translocase TatA/TatE family subunit [Actinomycetota bacterium]|jgi:sec-independent protein translocase protein TatA
MRLQGWEWIIILAIVLLLWGAPKLPGLAKSMAQSMRIFKKEIGTEAKPKIAEAKPEAAAVDAEVTPEGEQKQG